jgi:hypothetical protein
MVAMARTWTRKIAITVPPVAPRLFRTAIEFRFRSTKAVTALATPTPPTSSAVSPTSVRNCEKRRMLLVKRGSRHLGERLRQALVRIPAGRQREAVAPAHEAPGLQEPARPQRLLRHDQARPEADPVRDLVGLGDEAGAQLERAAADRDPGAGLEVEPLEQHGICDGAPGAVALGQLVGEGRGGIGVQRAAGRIARVDGLGLDEGRALRRHGHRPQARDDRDASLGSERGPLLRRRLALDQREGRIPAKDRPSLGRHALDQRARDGGDA